MIAELAIPRPRTRGDCQLEARPCPWVSCRHHLLLEIATARQPAYDDPRPTAIRLNSPSRGARPSGRRPGLGASAAAHVVRSWIADAFERLVAMEFTCSLDVVEAFPDGLEAWQVAAMLGTSEQLIDAKTRALVRRAEIRELFAAHENHVPVRWRLP
jgi:hypothetical protein